MVGIGAGNGRTYVLSPDSGSANLGNADATLWTPRLGETDFDIGAFEFQGSSADKTPPTVVSIAIVPANGGTTALGFTSFAITFSKQLDTVSATSPANYTLIAAGPDGQFDTVDDITIPVVPTIDATGTVVTLTLPNGALPNGQYRLTLSGTKAILDVSANKLAGSGGVAGRNYITTFTVSRTANHPPVAVAQSATVAEYGAVTLTLAATDADGDPITYSIAKPPSYGTLSAIDPVTHQVTYTPTSGTYGTDSFTFQAMDDNLGVGQATVSLTVTPVNLAPVATAQTVTVDHDQTRIIVLTATDAETPGSQLTYTIATQPAHGTLTQMTANSFAYTPAGYIGADSFTFTATDTGNPPGSTANRMTSAPVTVSLNVVDTAPHAVSDSYSVLAGFTLRVPASTGVLANDTDAEGDALTASLVYGQPQHGTVALAQDGSFVYTPNAGFTGTDSFSYVVADKYLQGNVATVTISVAPSPTPVIPPSKGNVPSAPPVVIPPSKAPVVAPPAPVTSNVVTTRAFVIRSAAVVAPESTDAAVSPDPVTSDDSEAPVSTDAAVAPASTLVAAYPVTVPTSFVTAVTIPAPAITISQATAPAVAAIPAVQSVVAAVAPVSAIVAASPIIVSTSFVKAVTIPAPAITVSPAIAPAAVAIPAVQSLAAPVAPVSTIVSPTTLTASFIKAATIPSPAMPVSPAAAQATVTIPAAQGVVAVAPKLDLSALMLPPVPSVQRLPAAMDALLRSAAAAPRLDPVFFDPITGDIQGMSAFDNADQDWLDLGPFDPTKHRSITWHAGPSAPQ